MDLSRIYFEGFMYVFVATHLHAYYIDINNNQNGLTLLTINWIHHFLHDKKHISLFLFHS